MSSLFTEEQFEAIYPKGVERHYWNHGRNMVVRHILRRIKPGLILDVGAGAGIVAAYLKRDGFKIAAVEPSPVPIPPELEGSMFAGIDLHALPADIRRDADTALLLDVIEHVPDPGELLRQLWSAAPNLQTLVVTVPAGKALWNNFDEFNGHYLRYSRAKLLKALQANRWAPVHVSYYFHALYWPALILAKLGFQRSVRIRPPSRWARLPHAFLAKIFFLEYKLLPSRLVGSSLVGVFERA